MSIPLNSLAANLTDLNNEEHELLISLLRRWYKQYKDNDNKWNCNKAGKALKAAMEILGCWKKKKYASKRKN